MEGLALRRQAHPRPRGCQLLHPRQGGHRPVASPQPRQRGELPLPDRQVAKPFPESETTKMADLSQLRLGTAPDSWGVWFPSDPHQVTWDVYLDEIARVGYVYTELGPQGFMPQDPEQLKDELARRGLTVCGGTVFAGLHKGPEALEQAKREFGQEAKLLSAVGAEYLVHLPEQYTDQHTGEATEGADLDAEQWKNLVTGTDELARYLFEEYGVKLVSTRTPTPMSTPRTGSSGSCPTPTPSW